MDKKNLKYLGKFPNIYREDMTAEDVEKLDLKVKQKKDIVQDEAENVHDIIQKDLEKKENLLLQPIALNKDKDIEKYQEILENLVEKYLENEKTSKEARITRHLTGADNIDGKIEDLKKDISKYKEEIKNLENKKAGILPNTIEENKKKIEFLTEKIEKVERLIYELSRIESDNDFEAQKGLGASYK
ncbi:MAG: hypothetical protein V4504_00005, partial [Patescibacteria group bacterium]